MKQSPYRKVSPKTSVEWLFDLSKQREMDVFDLNQAMDMHREEMLSAQREILQPRKLFPLDVPNVMEKL